MANGSTSHPTGIVEAVGTASGQSRSPWLAARIEAAMAQAVLDALASGVSIHDSAELLERKQAARRSVLAESGRV